MANKRIPESTVSRLFLYLREISSLLGMNIRTVSSAELGDRVNLSDVQIRKDLGHVGQFGTSGAGYDTEELKNELEKILGKNKIWNVAVVGAGHLGYALLTYPGFKTHNLNMIAAFDSEEKKIGKKIGSVTVQGVSEISKTAKDKKIAIGVVAVPAESAQGAADKLVSAGIECILNFAPVALLVPESVKVKDVDLSRELEALSYFLTNNKR